MLRSYLHTLILFLNAANEIASTATGGRAFMLRTSSSKAIRVPNSCEIRSYCHSGSGKF